MALTDVFSHLGIATPAGILWDMDGTLVDSESEWTNGSKVVVEKHGGVWTEDDSFYIFGASTAAHQQRMAEAVERGTGTAGDGEALFAELHDYMADAYGDPIRLPGGLDIVRAAEKAGIPQALVTATQQDLVDIALKSLDATFNAVVTGSEAIPGKPDPAPFIRGAEKLGLAPEDCIAFEDSVAGLAAARASGARTFDVAEVSLAELAELLER